MADMATNLPPPDKIRSTAQEIVTRRDYRIAPESSESGYKLAEKVSEFFRDLFAPFSSAMDQLHQASPIAWWCVVILLIMMLIGLVAHIVWSIQQAFKRRNQKNIAEPEGAPVNAGADYWETKAAGAVEAKDYVSAIRYLLYASLVYLEQSASNKIRRGATNREYLRRYSRTPAVHPLGVLVEMVDQKWYGAQPCVAGDYEQCERAHEQIRKFTREKTANASAA